MKKTIQKPLSILLSLLMMLSVLPVSVFAEQWQTAQTQTAETAEPVEDAEPADDAEPRQGALLKAEITVGNVKSTYAVDETGKLVLVSEETIAKRGSRKAPQQQASPWADFGADTVYTAAQWALSHNTTEAAAFISSDGAAKVVYGVKGYDTFVDANHDLICDVCGYCLNGCTDGVTKLYKTDDIASGPDVDHKYYNAAGTWIGTDATGTYTYTQVDETGHIIYEDDGVTPKTVEVAYSYIQFESYTVDNDGVCDVCGKAICGERGHDFSDGYCDGCGSCMGDHIDNIGAKMDTPDGLCDECGTAPHTFVDSNDDNKCDVCGKDSTHVCTDIGGKEVDVGDDICDNCGYCIADCTDETGGENDTPDGKCDRCGKAMLSACEHSDMLGKTVCSGCGVTPCHQTLGNLQRLLGQLTEMKAYLLNNDAEDAAFHAWLADTFTPFLTAKEDGGSETGLASVIAMRSEIDAAVSTDRTFRTFLDRINALSADNLTSTALVGTLTTQDGVKTLNETGSFYQQVRDQADAYRAAYDAVKYDTAKAYYANYNDLDDSIATADAKLNALAGTLFDNSLEALYGSSTPKKITVTAENRNSVRAKLRAVEAEEAILVKLYGANYLTADVQTKANDAWDASSPSYSGDQERRCVGFAMLDKVQFEINQLKEAAFTNYDSKSYDTQTDESGNPYYARRDGREDDILRDPNNDNDDYTVYDETIRTVIQKIDGYIGSPEAVAIITKLLPDSFGVTPEDYDNDGSVKMYDLLMSILMQKVLSDDLINQLFALIYPTVTGLNKNFEEWLTDNDYVVKHPDEGRYRIDVVKAITLLAGGSASLADTLSEVLDFFAVGGSFDFYVDGGKANTFKELLTNANFRFWPEQMATLLSQANSTKYASIISALNGCSDNWDNLLDANGNLNFKWNVQSFADVKEILSVICSSLAPVLEMLFASTMNQYKKLDLSNASYISLLISVILISIPLATDAGVEIDFDAFRFYEDVIVPIFEALGINDFAYGNSYTFQRITFETGDDKTVQNVRKVVDGLVDPIMVLLQQFVSHPLEKLLSILPNLALMLENGALFDLFDLDVDYSIFLKADFNMTTGQFFSSLGDIITDQIMKHWYDWLNPLKYAQLVATLLAYTVLETLVGMVMSLFSLLDMGEIASMLNIDLSGTLSSMFGGKLVSPLKDVFEKLAATLGGKLPQAELDRFKNWPTKDMKIDELATIFSRLNPHDLLEALFLSPQAQTALGFDLGKISTVLQWFFGNLQDQDGNHMALFDLDLLNLDELSSLGELNKHDGSIREAKYTRHWNSLADGQYYFVAADVSDVFYYCLNMVTGALRDKTTFGTILSLIGVDYDTLKSALASVAADGMDTLSLTLSDILKDATDENGKLDLDKILEHLTTDNLLLVLCELLVPSNGYELDQLEYPETTATTASEIDSHDSTIPYLEYDNYWTKDIASFIVDDIDDFADTLLQEIPLDLDESTDKIETLREYAKPLLLKYLNEPAYLTLITRLLAGVYDDDLALPADLIKDATGIDISVWTNDFAYLFDETAAPPTEKHFTKLQGTRTGTDENGDPVVAWTYDGEPVETYGDIFAALGDLLTPAQPLLDMVFCGEDFRALTYSENGSPAGSLVTVKGHDGYNFTILPLLEAMGVDALTSEQFKDKGTAQGLLYVVDQIVDRLFEIFDSDTMLADLFEMLAQLMFAVSENGVGVLTKNLLHPLWVLLDTIRPIVNIDLDSLLNTLVCRLTYKLGGYSSEQEMRQVMKTKGAEIKLKTLDLEMLLKLISVVASVQVDQSRYFLELKQPYETAINDLAYLRETYNSKAYSLTEDNKTYRLNTDGADALTAMVSMGIDVLMYGNNADVLDAFIELLLGQKGIAKTAVELMKGLAANYKTDFNWAYILGEDATAADKAALLAKVKQDGEIAADYRTAQAQADFDAYLASYDTTDWDEETAVHLAERVDDMIKNVLNAEVGDSLLGTKLLLKLGVESDATSYTLGSFLQEAVNGLLSDDLIDTVLGFVGDFLCGRDNELLHKLAGLINKEHPEDALRMMQNVSAKLAQYRTALNKAATVLGIDLKQYNIDPSRTVRSGSKVTYYDADGNKLIVRPVLKKNLQNLDEILYELTKPVQPLLAFALLGKDLSLLNASGAAAARSRRDDLIHVTGVESYRYVLLPLLEALGVEGLKPAADYISGDTYKIDALMRDLLAAVNDRVCSLVFGGDSGKVLDGLLETIPDLLYYLNSNALGVSAQNLTAQITAVLDFYNDYAGKTGDDKLTLTGILKQFTGLDIDLENISLTYVLSLISVAEEIPDENRTIHHPLIYDDFIVRLLDNFTVGKIYYNAASACDFDTYRMTYGDSKDKAATITIFASLALDLLEDPANRDFWTTLLGDDVYQTLANLFHLNDFDFDYQDPTWLFTEYADTDHLVSALTLSKLFDVDPYAGKLWTREKAAELAENLEQFIADMLYLLGLEINGIKINDLRSLMHALIGGTIFSNDTLNALTKLLGKIKPLLDKYDPDRAIADFIKKLTDIDLHAWDAYAEGGAYENGRDWGFSTEVTEAAVDANGDVFEAALIELLSPVAPAMAWMLADSDMTFFIDGDGLGQNAEPIQITLPGAEGYKYALVPLFEALNIDGSPKNLVQNLRDGDICDPTDYTAKVKQDETFAVTGVIHPLIVMIQKLMDSTATQLLELLPSIVYFINCNGIDTVVKNLIHSVLIIANAAEPMKNQISALVYDEQGIDLYRTLNVEKLVKDNVYEMLGITEADVAEIYVQCGGEFSSIDGLEDLDFRMLFSIGLAMVNHLLAEKGFPFKFTSIAALAVNELTHGYVRSFASLTGKTAYTMVLDKTIDKYCFGDLLSILIRIILKFLSVDGNTEALMALIQTKANMSETNYNMTLAFLTLLASYMGTLGGFETAMLSIYYTVYGASKGSGAGVDAYDRVNDRWGGVVDKLTNLDNDIARAVMKALFAVADEQTGDIIGTDGIAGNGLIRFFKQIYDWLMKIVNFFRNLLHK